MAQDWKAEFAAKFATLASSAAKADAASREFKGVIGADGQERIEHVIVEPTQCGRCGLTVSADHDCVAELRKALDFATGGIQVIRR